MMQHPHVDRRAFLDSEERRRELPPERVIGLLPLRPDQTVADVGCGPGFFTLPLAQKLPEGTVIAVDVDREFLEQVGRKARLAGLKNVLVRRNRGYSLPLEPESLDGALVAFVLHDLRYPVRMLQALFRALRQGAWLAVVEWVKREEDTGPKPARRLSSDQVVAMASEAGFRPNGQTRYLSDRHYLILFRKP
jgi:ubiquinone/menaquinone biosynthesis C-methylase UbiE